MMISGRFRQQLAVFVSPEGLRSFRLGPTTFKAAVESSVPFFTGSASAAARSRESVLPYVLAGTETACHRLGRRFSSDLPLLRSGTWTHAERIVASSARKTSISKTFTQPGRCQGSEGSGKCTSFQYARKDRSAAMRVLAVGKRNPPIDSGSGRAMQSTTANCSRIRHLARTAIQHNPETQSRCRIGLQTHVHPLMNCSEMSLLRSFLYRACAPSQESEPHPNSSPARRAGHLSAPFMLLDLTLTMSPPAPSTTMEL